MTAALLTILAICILTIGWNLCAMLRDAAHRARWNKLADESLRQVTNADYFAVPAVKAPDLHSTANRTGALR